MRKVEPRWPAIYCVSARVQSMHSERPCFRKLLGARFLACVIAHMSHAKDHGNGCCQIGRPGPWQRFVSDAMDSAETSADESVQQTRFHSSLSVVDDDVTPSLMSRTVPSATSTLHLNSGCRAAVARAVFRACSTAVLTQRAEPWSMLRRLALEQPRVESMQGAAHMSSPR